jgi:20S proteasome alpha/beta subunit
MTRDNYLCEKIQNRYLSEGRDLTYILGARCKDGIALVGDKKVSRGYGSYEYEDKIFSDVPNVVIGASGVVSLFDKFRDEISSVARTNANIPREDFVREAERIVYKLNNEYAERTFGQKINLLVAYGVQRVGRLLHITTRGVGEVVRRYQVIGSGEPYGAYLLKTMWRNDLTMMQVAVLGSLIIKHVDDNELDDAVGLGKEGRPQIWFNADWPSPDEYDKLNDEQKKVLATREASNAEYDEIKKRAEEIYPKIEAGLKTAITL